MRPPYLTVGMRLEVLANLVRRHGVTPTPRYLGRLAFCTQAAGWSSLVAALERRHAREISAPLDPIIIPSHWRTGTTLVHQLMSLDPHLACPSLFQTTLPDSFLSSRPYAEPLLARAMSGPRPMDNVQLAFDAPQEDEYALYRLTGRSPLTRLIFPRAPGQGYFLDGDDTFLPRSPQARRSWEAALVAFVARVQHQARGRRVVLKNPFHAARLETLLRLFPSARFLHIRRSPLAVVPSTLRMWGIVAGDNTLRRGGAAPTMRQVARAYGRITRRLEAGLATLPPGRVATIRFEELEARPLEVMTAAYAELGLPVEPELERAMAAFERNNRAYKKNRYELSVAQRDLILDELGDLL